MSDRSPEFDDWVNAARKMSVEDVVFERYPSIRKVKTSEGWAGECPVGHVSNKKQPDHFSINLAKNLWNCRHCGKGGDAISLVMNVENMDFIQAVRELTGEDPPGQEPGSGTAPKPRRDEDVVRETQERRRVEADNRAAEDARKKREERKRIHQFWDECLPFPKSHADAYLKSRGIALDPAYTFDLRFCPDMPYRGFADANAVEETQLGRFPAMIAAIRDLSETIIGLHRTYLDPKTAAKLTPVGDPDRFKAKKVWGLQAGGFILLSPPCEDVCTGEGIETTASFWRMGVGPEPLGMICGINLGNISGGATGSVPHPRSKSKTILNGTPSPEKPGLVFPAWVKRAIFLVDGDSESYATRAKILTGARRAREAGISVSIAEAMERYDFNNMLRMRAA